MTFYVHQNWNSRCDTMSKTRVFLSLCAVALFLTIQQILEIHKILDVLLQLGVILAAGAVVTLCARSATVSDPPSPSHISARLAAQRVLGVILAFFFPRYGQCYRCLMPWAVTKHHLTRVETPGVARSVFALCECCYRQTAPEERLRYYTLMWADWVSRGMEPSVERWSALRYAVLHEEEMETVKDADRQKAV